MNLLWIVILIIGILAVGIIIMICISDDPDFCQDIIMFSVQAVLLIIIFSFAVMFVKNMTISTTIANI